MGNTVGGSNDAVIAMQGFEAFADDLPILSAFSTNFSSEIMNTGESVTTRVITARTAGTWTDGTSTYNSGDTVATGKTVTLNQSFFSSAHISDTEAGKTRVDVLGAYARECGKAMAKKIVDDVVGAVTASTFGNTTSDKIVVGAAAFDIDDVVDAWKLATAKYFKPVSLVLDFEYAAALMKDNVLQKVNESGSAEVLREGMIGRLFGMNVYAYNFPSVDSGVLKGFLCHPSCLAFATRPVAPDTSAPNAPAVYVATDPKGSGLSLGYRHFYDNSYGREWIAYHNIWGKVAVQTTGVVRICNA